MLAIHSPECCMCVYVCLHVCVVLQVEAQVGLVYGALAAHNTSINAATARKLKHLWKAVSCSNLEN